MINLDILYEYYNLGNTYKLTLFLNLHFLVIATDSLMLNFYLCIIRFSKLFFKFFSFTVCDMKYCNSNNHRGSTLRAYRHLLVSWDKSGVLSQSIFGLTKVLYKDHQQTCKDH